MDPLRHPPESDAIEPGQPPGRPALTSTQHSVPPQACDEIQEEPLVCVPGTRAGDQDPEWTAHLLARIAKPGWAEERAIALLRTGATMPEMIEHLVAKGLSAAEATRIAEKVFEDRVRQQSAPQQRAERRTWLHRVLSAVVGLSLIALVWCLTNTQGAAGVTLCVMACLFLIWYPNWLDSTNRFNRQTPNFMVRMAGWVFLLAMVLPIFLLLLGVLLR